MPIFYLCLRDHHRIEDPEGGDYADFNAARRDAVIAARGIMAERLRTGELLDGFSIESCDAHGTFVDTIKFRDVMRLS